MDARGAIVVGAGLAGLTAGLRLARMGVPVTVLDGRGRPGGRARSTARDGFVVNLGPHELAPGGLGTAILEELGIDLAGERGGGAVVQVARFLPLGGDAPVVPGAPGLYVAGDWVGVRGTLAQASIASAGQAAAAAADDVATAARGSTSKEEAA